MTNNGWRAARFAKGNMAPLLELRKQQFGDNEFVNAEYIRWQFAENPSGEAIGWIALNDQDSVLGEYWIVPIVFKISETNYLGSIGANALVHPRYRLRKIFTTLGEKCAEDCVDRKIAFTLYMPNRTSLAGLVHNLGCKDMGEIPFLIYPVNIEKLAEFKFGSKPIRRIAACLMSNIWNLTARRGRRQKSYASIEVNSTTFFDEQYNRFWEAVKTKYSCMTVRDSGFMNWRYNYLSLRKYKTYLAKGNGRILGYMVSRSTDIFGLKTGFIMDFLYEQSDFGRAAGINLIGRALDDFTAADTDIVCCLSPAQADEYTLLKKHGFLVCPHFFKPHLFHLVSQIHGGRINGTLLNNLDCWYWSLGDYDIV